MNTITPHIWRYFQLVPLVMICRFSDCYDPLDPNGNITVTFDTLKYTHDGYVARITIQNNYQYRHVEEPDWKLGWTWAKNEVIWSMAGAFAIHQGNCSSFKYHVPHSCKPDPVIVDLMSDATAQNRSVGCCRGGILSSSLINPSASYSSFEIMVGNVEENCTGCKPLNLTLAAPGPGYTCGPVMDSSPTVYSVIGGRREEQVSRTWISTCTYSSYIASKTPICCVSLSTFYNPAITSCPSCSCGCRVANPLATSCIRGDKCILSQDKFNKRYFCLSGYSVVDVAPLVFIAESREFPSNLLDINLIHCTDHMCPLRVHWHIMNIYVNHWRVKLTVSNFNYGKNYLDWNVLVQHPGFGQPSVAFSFNSTIVPTVGVPEDITLFWGKAFHNANLMKANKGGVGSVTTEILLQKDSSSFTLSNGWGFPRAIHFNGENCRMPLPDTFPMLPSSSLNRRTSNLIPVSSNAFLLLIIHGVFCVLSHFSFL